VKSEFQEELCDITTVKEKLKDEVTLEGSKMSISRDLMDAPMKRPRTEPPLKTLAPYSDLRMARLLHHLGVYITRIKQASP
jgi:hypothetical protein